VRRLPHLAALALAVLAAAPVHAEVQAASEVDPRVRWWLGKRTVEVIATADRGEIVRVAPEPIDPKAATRPPNVGGYAIVGETRALDARLLAGFREVLLDRGTHDIPPPGVGQTKLCGPIKPGVALRFWAKSDRKRHAPVEVLLCFACHDLLVVGPRASPQSFTPGTYALLRLAAIGLPQYTELEQMLASGAQNEARERLFESLFPADIQLAMRNERWDREATNTEAAARLRARFAAPELVRLAARALALRDRWDASPKSTQVVVEAVKALSSAELLAALRALRGDQLALAGATELLYRGARDRLKPEERLEFAPALAEAALVQSASAPRCSILQAVARAGPAAVPLLIKVRRNELTLPPSGPAPAFDKDPTPSACAMLALARADKAKASEELRAWQPRDLVDAAIARIVRAQLGDGDVADPALFAANSTVVALAALDVYSARPTAAAVDVIVHSAIGHDHQLVRERGEEVFTVLTGFVVTGMARDDRAKVARTWWKEHRSGWRPPAGTAR
jgi:hypothetical protein